MNLTSFFGKIIRSVLFWSFLLTGLVYFSLRLFLLHENTPVKVAKDLSQKLERRSSEAVNIKIDLIEKIQKQKQVGVSSNDNLFELEELYEKDFFVGVLKNEKIIFWNHSDYFSEELIQSSDTSSFAFDKTTGSAFLLESETIGEFKIIVMDLVYENHTFSNDHINIGFAPEYGSYADLYLLKQDSSGVSYPVLSKFGKPLFYIQSKTANGIPFPSFYLIYLFLALLLLLAFAYVILYRILPGRNKINSVGLNTLIFVGAIVLIQTAMRIAGPGVFFFDSELFDPMAFSSGILLPSLGFLLLHVEAFLAIALALYNLWIKDNGTNLTSSRLLRTIFYVFAFFILLVIQVYVVENIFYQTSVPLTFSKFFMHNAWSYAVFGSAAMFSIATIVLLRGLFTKITYLGFKKPVLFLIFLGVFVFLSVLIYLFKAINIALIPFMAAIILIFFFHSRSIQNIRNQFITLSISLFFVFSALLTYLIFTTNKLKSEQSQQLTALQLSTNNDPLFEFLWSETEKQLRNDTVIQSRILLSENDKSIVDQQIKDYFFSKYVSDYYKKYDIELTICNSTSELLIQPENLSFNCESYFNEMVRERGTNTNIKGLYLIDDDIQGVYYLAIIPFGDSSGAISREHTTLYFEFYFKYIPEGLGYPELLIDERKGFSKEITNYSFATYKDSVLIYKSGNYLYPSNYYQFNSPGKSKVVSNNFSHIIHKSENGKIVVVSLPVKSLAIALAPFAFFFLLMAIPGFAFFLLSDIRNYLKQLRITFRFKLQILIISSLLLSFIIIGFSTVYYITDVYNKKNDDFLFEKTQSILIELEHKLKNEDISRAELQDYLHQLLLKFSLVFFSDINLYDLNGRLLASSRYDIFDQHLVSKQMNPQAYRAMFIEDKLYFKHEEQIGDSRYLSSYIPFKSEKGDVLAYINLPYFARESEIRNEISSLILTYINLFLVISGVVVFLVLLLSRRLLQPLQMIQDKMRSLRIDRVNEKIVWKSKDELGQFVAQYNTLLDELAESAERLARSERESAWREMAKQVAHEIKNPLTPMRLSVQYLLKAWNDEDPDIAKKIKNTSETLINQIDTLSSIASAFSDFARLPVSKPEKINMVLLLNNLIVLFNNHPNITFKTNFEHEAAIWISADQANMNRIFTNLIKNSLQAIGERQNGLIDIQVHADNNRINIIIKDNGKGMSSDEARRVFTPNFTTKSSGMGIGLAMVHNLVTTAGGEIHFETEQGSGTTFYLQLPLF